MHHYREGLAIVQPQQYPQQQYPQPGYAPQPQQGYPPAGQPYPQPAPSYPPQSAPPAQQVAPGYGGPNPQGGGQFANPAPPQSNIVRPRMTDFGHDGRLVIITPKDIARGVPNNLGKPGETQDRMTADVVILDGHPFPFGGAPEKGRQHTTQASIPYEIPSMWISNVGLISQCERRIGEMVLGRLRSIALPNGNSAYRIDDPTDADRATAAQYVIARQSGAFTPPTPPAAATPAPAPQAPPMPPQYAPQGYPQSAPPVQQPYGDPYAAQQYPPQQGYPAQGPTPVAPQQWAPPAQQLDVNVAPSGYPGGQDAWNALPPDQRAMIAGAAASQQRPGV